MEKVPSLFLLLRAFLWLAIAEFRLNGYMRVIPLWRATDPFLLQRMKSATDSDCLFQIRWDISSVGDKGESSAKPGSNNPRR